MLYDATICSYHSVVNGKNMFLYELIITLLPHSEKNSIILCVLSITLQNKVNYLR